MNTVQAIIFDFSRVLLHPKDEHYAGKLNDLYRDKKTKPNFNFFEFFVLDQTLLSWLETKKQHVKLCLYTSEFIQKDPSILPSLEKVFDGHIYSAQELGLSKGKSEDYLKLLEKLGTVPAQSIFIDDSEDNIKASQAAGLTGIQFFSTEQVIERLTKLLSE